MTYEDGRDTGDIEYGVIKYQQAMNEDATATPWREDMIAR